MISKEELKCNGGVMIYNRMLALSVVDREFESWVAFNIVAASLAAR
jgi:hypothetical protein